MKNIPRIFINQKIEPNKNIPVDKDVVHYLKKVMRTNDCLVFNSGDEFYATVSDDLKYLIIGKKTEHTDSGNDVTLYFSPIKKTDEMLNMATQMGISRIQPVITDRTVAHHINWTRMKKIIIEASEQSNRNSIPELLPEIKFDEFVKNIQESKIKMAFADERVAYDNKFDKKTPGGIKHILIGPEGGFSNSEFDVLDSVGATGISLGKTILRAETAAVAALAKIIL